MTPELEVTWDPLKAQTNRAKHGVTFAQAATALLDPFAITVFDAEHSAHEERWFTLGLSQQGALLAVAHTYRSTGSADARVRIISARAATRREREQYQNTQRSVMP